MTEEERKQIDDLYRQMYDMLFHYARSAFEGNEALAEEAVQETFRIACQIPKEVCGCPKPQGWLVLALRNTVRNIKSTRKTAKRIVEQYLLAQAKELTVTEDGIKLDILYENVADTEEFKLLLEMAVEGRSHKEMALARGITVDACKKRVQRAKEVLQRRI